MTTPAPLSTHRFMAWIVAFQAAVFVGLMALFARDAFTSPQVGLTWRRLGVVLVICAVGGFLAWQAWTLLRQRVTLHEDGVRWRLAKGPGFLAWDEIVAYRFERVQDSRLLSPLDGWYRRRGTRFSWSGGGSVFVATVLGADGRSVSINSGFTRVRDFCSQVVDRVDPGVVAWALDVVRSGRVAGFGEVTLQAGFLSVPAYGDLPLQEVHDIRVLDGQVQVVFAGSELEVGSVPNAYALAATWRALRGGAGLTPASR